MDQCEWTHYTWMPYFLCFHVSIMCLLWHIMTHKCLWCIYQHLWREMTACSCGFVWSDSSVYRHREADAYTNLDHPLFSLLFWEKRESQLFCFVLVNKGKGVYYLKCVNKLQKPFKGFERDSSIFSAFDVHLKAACDNFNYSPFQPFLIHLQKVFLFLSINVNRTVFYVIWSSSLQNNGHSFIYSSFILMPLLFFCLFVFLFLRQDFFIMFVHHLATILLITFSYTNNMVRVGTMIMSLHDASDIFLEVKTCGLVVLFF